jgi:Fe-S cluster assembly ATPase SufC
MLEDANLKIAEGECAAIIGPPRADKPTLAAHLLWL